MLKGFAITPVINGRISIGKKVKNGERSLPQKTDEFRLTMNVQNAGEWLEHPVAKGIREANQTGQGKLQRIPVRVMFDKPENNFRAEQTCFDNKGRPLCSGDGENAKRRKPNGEIEDVQCGNPAHCQFGKENRCKQFGRLIVAIEDDFERDPLSGFMFRTTSFNSIRALTYRLNALAALSGGQIAGMPCDLKLKAKSSSGSMGQAIYYVDLEPRGSLVEAMTEMKKVRTDWEAAGINRAALEDAVTAGYAASAFEDEEEGAEVVEELVGEGEGTPEPTRAPQAGDRAIALTQSHPATETQLLPKGDTPFNPLSDEKPFSVGQVDPIELIFKEVMEKVQGIDDLGKVDIAEPWIKQHGHLTDSQKKAAMELLSKKKADLQAVKKAA